jgi:hypothetical protein
MKCCNIGLKPVQKLPVIHILGAISRAVREGINAGDSLPRPMSQATRRRNIRGVSGPARIFAGEKRGCRALQEVENAGVEKWRQDGERQNQKLKEKLQSRV